MPEPHHAPTKPASAPEDAREWKVSVRSWANALKDPLEAPLDLWRLSTAERRVLPNVIMLGAQRAGTTSLYQYLAQHPLFVPAITKEIHYFDRHWDRSLTWYRANFPLETYQRMIQAREGQAPITGEATPGYLFHPGIPERVASLGLDARFIVVLRDPVARAYSHYHHTRRNGWEPLSFEEAIDAEAARLDGEFERHREDPEHVSPGFFRHSYLSRGRYAEQLERWFDRFDRDRFLVLFSRDLFADPNAVLWQVTDFLGLPPFQVETPDKHNAGSYDAMPKRLRRRLRSYYEPQDEALSELLGRELPWRKSETLLA